MPLYPFCISHLLGVILYNHPLTLLLISCIISLPNWPLHLFHSYVFMIYLFTTHCYASSLVFFVRWASFLRVPFPASLHSSKSFLVTIKSSQGCSSVCSSFPQDPLHNAPLPFPFTMYPRSGLFYPFLHSLVSSHSFLVPHSFSHPMFLPHSLFFIPPPLSLPSRFTITFPHSLFLRSILLSLLYSSVLSRCYFSLLDHFFSPSRTVFPFLPFSFFNSSSFLSRYIFSCPPSLRNPHHLFFPFSCPSSLHIPPRCMVFSSFISIFSITLSSVAAPLSSVFNPFPSWYSSKPQELPRHRYSSPGEWMGRLGFIVWGIGDCRG